MAHVHPVAGERPLEPGRHRLLLLALVPFLIVTAIGALVLWPSDESSGLLNLGFDTDLVNGRVESAVEGACDITAPDLDAVCSVYRVRLQDGPEKGETITLEMQDSPTTVTLEEGDGIVLNRVPQAEVPEDLRYSFADFQRTRPLWILLVLFIVAVVAFGRWQGVRSLIGLGLSLVVLIVFVLPAILEGSNAVAVALVGAAAIMFITLYLAHGVNDLTTTAVLGTLVSLGFTGVLAAVFVALTEITGFADEAAVLLRVGGEDINLRGLVLAGIIIGTLGVLDDVTVTQSSAVWELARANPTYGFGGLYRSALRIGRDHIASTVNTLVLAYAGASLPLLIVFLSADRGLGDVLAGETVAIEIVRTLVGSIGLVASVPITTALGAAVVSGALPDRRPR